MSFKVGDIVTISPFEGESRVGGVYCLADMTKEIGQTHIVTHSFNHEVYRLDDRNDYNWPGAVLRPATTHLPTMAYIGSNFIPVILNEGGVWVDPNKEFWVYYDVVGLYEEEVIELPYNIYGVGQKGELIKSVRFRGANYLAPDYLPMKGVIRGEELCF